MSLKRYIGVIIPFLILICLSSVLGISHIDIKSDKLVINSLPDKSTRYVYDYNDWSDFIYYEADRENYKYYGGFQFSFWRGDVTHQYVDIIDKQIADGKALNCFVEDHMLISARSPPSYSTVLPLCSVTYDTIKTPGFIDVDYVYVPKVGDYAQFSMNNDVMVQTKDMSRTYLLDNFFVDPPLCINDPDTSLLSPIKDANFEGQADLSKINDYVTSANNYVLDESMLFMNT